MFPEGGSPWGSSRKVSLCKSLGPQLPVERTVLNGFGDVRALPPGWFEDAPLALTEEIGSLQRPKVTIRTHF